MAGLGASGEGRGPVDAWPLAGGGRQVRGESLLSLSTRDGGDDVAEERCGGDVGEQTAGWGSDMEKAERRGDEGRTGRRRKRRS